MVATAKRTSPPLTGCVQVFSANKPRATLSSPGAGGALNSEPTTEKRKRAHRAAVDGSDFLVIESPRNGKKGENRCQTLRYPGPPEPSRSVFCDYSRWKRTQPYSGGC